MSGGERTVWTVREVLQWTTGHFARMGLDSARLEAEVLLARVLGCDRVRLYMDHDRPLSPEERGAYRALVERRAGGEPSAYLVGEKEFYARAFKVDRRVLIPRPETEHVVDLALEALPKDAPRSVLDLCSGSGCIGVSLAAERPAVVVTAVDLSPEACALARENAERLGVAGRYEQLEGDLFAPLSGRPPFDVIVTNPPYVPDADIDGLQPEIRAHEPRSALAGGPDGLDLCRRILAEAADHLTAGGLLVMEHGEEQGPALLALARATGRYETVDIRKDHAGHDRVLVATTTP